MKLLQLFGLLSISLALVDAEKPQEKSSLRRRTAGLRDLTQPCLVLVAHMQLSGNREEEHVECELQGSDMDSSMGNMVMVNNLPRNFIRDNNVKSGQTTLFADGALIDDHHGELLVPSNAAVVTVNRRLSPEQRKLAVTGKRDVLVVRVAGLSVGEYQLADDVFGANGDNLNLKTQYGDCSYNQLRFEKSQRSPFFASDGVTTVHVPMNVQGVNNNDVRRAAVAKVLAFYRVSSLNQLADHVMLCIPPGTTPNGWIAYGYTNSYLTVYNDRWCSSVSAQMHEIGHNLGLAHAGDDSGTQYAQYEDQSGMMGFSYNQDDYPRMCFNAAKSWQLGWFSSYHVNLKPSGGSLNWSGNLIGFVDRANAGGGDNMIIRIESDRSDDDVYIHFNRKTGFNSGTLEGGDQVHVTSRPEGLSYAVSTRVSTLTAGSTHTSRNFEGSGNDLTVTVNSINFGSPSRAAITIQFGSAPVTQPPPAPNNDPSFVNNVSYKHNVLENESQWENRIRSLDVLDGANGDINAYFQHYGITMSNYQSLTGSNAFNPSSSKMLNVPIDCTKRDDNFIVMYTGVGKTAAAQGRVKDKPCSWFVANNAKFCPLVDMDPARAVVDPVSGETVRPRIFQTCHQECESYTKCNSKG